MLTRYKKPKSNIINITKNNEDRNTSVDIGRLIAAFLVVCLHTYFPIALLGSLIASLGKIVVPFFLIVSGYYIYSSEEDVVRRRSIRMAIKLSKVTLQAGCIYLILRFIKHQYFGLDVSDQEFNLMPFLLANDFRFTEHLWYCFAYLYVLVITIVVAQFKKIKYLLYVIPLLFVIHFVFTIWSRFISIPDGKFLYELNWLVVGLPYFVFGMFLKSQDSWLCQADKGALITLMGLLFISIFAEHYAFKTFAGRGPGVFSAAFLSAACAIYCLLNYQIVSGAAGEMMAEFGRKHALNIYLYHVLIREILTLLDSNRIFNNSISIFLAAILLSIGIDSVQGAIQRKISLRSSGS